MGNAAVLSIEDAIKAVKTSVPCPKPLPWRLSSVNRIGEGGRQGDLYFKIIKKPSGNLKKVKNFNGQLAPGNTPGSRHIVDPSKITAYENPAIPTISTGMIFHTNEDCSVDHPQHGTVNLEKGLWIEVAFQVNYFLEQAARVKD